MILCDDNFSTIVSAVKEGRVIFSNIKKAVHFLLSSNMGEIVTIFFAILIGWQTPLAADSPAVGQLYYGFAACYRAWV